MRAGRCLHVYDKNYYIRGNEYDLGACHGCWNPEHQRQIVTIMLDVL